MKRILRALVSGVGITVMLALVFTALVWFLGGFLGFGDSRPLESVFGRVVGIALIWVAALVTILIVLLRRERRDAALTEDIVATPEPAGTGEDAVVTEELVEMRGKLKTALARLRKSKHGRKSLYELPWYVMIGPPGAGKTTAIVNSGLNFPLAEETGRAAIGGVGGTRNCDWWFTDEAVLIDTAGRYTTQESDKAADNAGWLGFLDLLKRHRKRQPINGALVAISLSDLSLQDEVTQRAHAQAIRRRLNELREKLGVRFPVYVLFTKADLVAGFSEFFDSLGQNDRGQVWGWSYPLDTATKTAPEVGPAFDQEFSTLLARLNEKSLDRMQSETDPQRRSLIAGFPMQLASARQTARSFLTELFQESRYEHRQLLRGVYFTSGTQEGTPVDRLLVGMARTFGLGRQALGSGRGSGRSYFLTGLFQNVIFRESGLVSADDKVARRFRWTRRAAVAATILVAVGLGSFWLRSYFGNRALAAEVSEDIGAYRAAAADIPGNPVADSDLPSVLPALNILRDMPVAQQVAADDVPDGLGWGLYQGNVLGSSAGQAYREALNRHFLPRLLLRLEDQLTGNVNNSDVLFEALKVYLMLGQAGPLNPDLIREWMTLDWSLAFPGPTRAGLRADLESHLDTLLSQPMTQVELNGDLVDHVQTILSEMPQAQRVYNGILKSPAATALPEFRLSDIGGPAIGRSMVRSSGQALSEGIEGIFTRSGFHDVFLSEALSVAQRIQRDAWVLGPANEAAQSETTLAAISRDVFDLYYNDYISRYDKLLGDLDVVPLESLSHAVEITNVLSGPTSPLAKVLEAVAEETHLSEPRSSEAEGRAEAGAESLQENQTQFQGALLTGRRGVILEAMRAAASASGEDFQEPGEYVEERFAWLQDLVARQEGQPSQLDRLLESLTQVYQELNKLNFAGGIGSSATQSTALAAFQQEAARIEGPMQRWSQQVAVGSSGIAAGGTRAGINAEWQSAVLPFCTQVTGDAYPFNRRARADAAVQDFAKLFGPGGMIAAFFDEHLADFVNTSTRPWTWKTVNGTDLGISQAVLTQIENAAVIRDAFFASGGMGVNFQMTPEALDPNAKAISLEIDGTEIAFQQGSGQPRPVAVTWPGSVGLARIAFSPASNGSESSLSRDGPWAWFRLLDAAEVRRTNASDRKRIIFRVGGRIAIFQMQSSTVNDPFALPALANFSCPKSF
ncbi:type VI secretion system membrane subunit TssM [Pseudooceanicola sp. C21-150M6]|uniref:type VI secretion system membrane subunit TssM n=1 Tax=Pseudooceanicola sp. C21-150M6 TaxID=3434355 RepID=UPI003D7F32C1